MVKLLPKLTEDEHKVIGTLLKRQDKEIRELLIDISHRYGVSSKPARLIEKLYHLHGKMRSEMDNQLFRDYPDIVSWQGVYYGDAR